MAYVHLHNRSTFSILDGAMRPAEIVAHAAAMGMEAVGMTDTCNLYGAVEFHGAARGAGIHPVFGSEIWLWPDGLDSLDDRSPDGGWHLVLLIENKAGYHNLCKLITNAIFDGMHYRPRIDLAQLAEHRDGLIALTGGLNGPLGPAARGDLDTPRASLQRLGEILGPEHLYVELMDTGLPGQPQLCDAGRQLAQQLGLLTVVSNDCRYKDPTDAVTLDLLNAIARGEPLDDPQRQGLPTDQQDFKSAEQMEELFPDDAEALERTSEIAFRCQYDFHKAPPYFFPATSPPDKDEGGSEQDTDANWEFFYDAFPPMGGVVKPDPRPAGTGTLNGYFEWYSRIGLELRLRYIAPELHEAYRDRLEREIKIIEEMGFPAYLLIVAEFINWAKDHEIPVGPGRGSAAGSIVAWAQRITDIDPMRFALLFERFLNPERISMPDIDVDFCQDRREEVIQHVRDKYGAELVSQIITYGQLKAKAALKDVARVCGMRFTEADHVAKLVPNDLKITIDTAMDDDRFRKLVEGDPIVGRVKALARRVEGMTRQTGVHAAGVVIADRPVVEHAPMYRDGPEGGPVVQYAMASAEQIGLIKFDFLGLKTLDQLRDTVAMVHRNTGERIDLAAIPDDDPETFRLLQTGDALGVFQVESSGMRELLTKLRPTTLEDLVALVALYRPGPMNLIPSFIARKHGYEEIEYQLPIMEPILRETYGIIVYQEQVMQIVQDVGGYSLGGADLLRRAMGKKKLKEMEKHRPIFVKGAVERGTPAEKAEEIYELLIKFASYGFNKSHSAAYGWVSYQTAYLKARHRGEYMAALMSIESANTDKLLMYLGDCRRAGLKVLPPDVNHSQPSFDVPRTDRRSIRFGLTAIKGVGTGAVESITEARAEAGGAFKDLTDFMTRLDYRRVNKKVLESLVKCGALDWTGHARRAMFEGLERSMAVAQQIIDERHSPQVGLFGGTSVASTLAIRLPDVGEWPTAIKLGHEKEALGFFITGHPIEAYSDLVKRVATCTINRLGSQPEGEQVSVAGMVSSLKRIRSKRGSRMAFATVEDTDAAVECIFFADPYARSQRVLEADQPILLTGKLEHGEEGHKILAESAELLSDVRVRRTRQVDLHLDAHELDNGQLDKLDALLRGSEGSCPVKIYLRFPGKAITELRLPAQLTVVPDEEFIQGLESLFQRADVPRLKG